MSLPALAFLLAATATGCYHATGFQRPEVVAEEIPPTGGERVPGMKSAAGPGDYHIGNDYLSVAVDGSLFGDPKGSSIAGAYSGGSIVDICQATLDQNFKRVAIPGDSMDRLTPVLNQDPELPIVIDKYSTHNEYDRSTLEMYGKVLDVKGKLAGVTRDAQNRIQGLDVVHRLTLDRMAKYVLLETVLTNTGTAALPVRNVADHLFQTGGGYRLTIPAKRHMDNTPVTDWGMDLPGCDFTHPLDSSVTADHVVMHATEPGAATMNSHTSLGLMADDFSPLVVASSPQSAMKDRRPQFATNMVAGCQPVASLAAGASLTYRRRLYVLGNAVTYGLPSESMAIINSLVTEQMKPLITAGTKNEDLPYAHLSVSLSGTSMRGGVLPTEVKLERKDGNDWVTERVAWFEAPDLPSSTSMTGSTFDFLVKPGTYQIRLTHAEGTRLFTTVEDDNSTNERGNLPVPIVLTSQNKIVDTTTGLKDKSFVVGSKTLLMVENGLVDANNTFLTYPSYTVSMSARPAGDAPGSLQPIRFTLSGRNGTLDPVIPRGRALAGTFDIYSKAKTANVNFLGSFQTWGGNIAFGMNTTANNTISVRLKPGEYNVFATRGPLSELDLNRFKLTPTDIQATANLIAFNPTLPAGWMVLDQPGPSLASDGGLHPTEMLGGALAEGINILVDGEKDSNPDAKGLRDDFRSEIEFSGMEDYRKAIGDDPLVIGARTSDLGSYGRATAWFTPAADREMRRNGARLNTDWTLADFLSQAAGSFTVIHRPRDPKTGLFTLKGYNPAEKLTGATNSWLGQTGLLSLGKTNGQFDALELLRGEGLDSAHPEVWFNEFKAVRADWFSLLNQQMPTAFTKALGLSGSHFTADTPIGLARTYIKATGATQDSQQPLLSALQSGALVASTGPMLDVTVGGAAPGGLVAGPVASVTVQGDVYAPSWVPMDEVRIVVNGVVQQTLPVSAMTRDTVDARKRHFSVQVPVSVDGWVVVEAGVPLTTTGIYAAGTPWNAIMKGIYPVAVTNPVFVDANGGGYVPPVR